MAGRRKTPGPPCYSGEPSNAPWLPTSSTKMHRPSCFGNGLPARTTAYSTGTATLGTACCSKGIQLVERFCQDDRIRIRQPRRNLQIKFMRPVSEKNDFVAYVDAIGKLDGTRGLIEWKTTSSRYAEEPDGLLALDPQLVCYSWITGISEVAQ